MLVTIILLLIYIGLPIAASYDDFRSDKYGVLVLKAIILIVIISLFI